MLLILPFLLGFFIVREQALVCVGECDGSSLQTNFLPESCVRDSSPFISQKAEQASYKKHTLLEIREKQNLMLSDVHHQSGLANIM